MLRRLRAIARLLGEARICRKGSTRSVLLIGRYAVKVPVVGNYHRFLKGLVANLTEGKLGRMGHPELARVHYCSAAGVVLVMERLRPVKNRGLFWVDLEELAATADLPKELIFFDAMPENFGYRPGQQLVKLDYGH